MWDWHQSDGVSAWSPRPHSERRRWRMPSSSAIFMGKGGPPTAIPQGWGCPHALLSWVLALAQSPHCRQSCISQCSRGSTASRCCFVPPQEQCARPHKVHQKSPKSCPLVVSAEPDHPWPADRAYCWDNSLQSHLLTPTKAQSLLFAWQLNGNVFPQQRSKILLAGYKTEVAVGCHRSPLPAGLHPVG